VGLSAALTSKWIWGAELTRYSYGVLGELQRVELPDGRAITYQYDALKRRIGRQVNGASTHRWLWGGGPGPVAELDANGNTLTTFVYGTGINAPDYMVRGAEMFALIRDHLGSVRFVLNTADNTIAQELRYDPFGNVTLDTNPGFQPFGYAGGLYDPDTELTRFGARDYDAHTGRWTARDPIAFGGGQTNLYVYVGNDPINYVDPNGEAALPAAVLAALGAIWAGIEFSLTVVDIIDTATTLMDPCASDIDKTLSVSGLLVGAVTVGGGYGIGAKALHGNSRWSQRATHVYEIRNLDTWEVVKTGISSGPISKMGKSYRAEFQRRRWGAEEYVTSRKSQRARELVNSH